MSNRNDTNTWGFLAGIVIAILLFALLMEFAWNVGLVGTLAAAGIAQISGISYWTALGTVALLMVVMVVRGLFVNVSVDS